MHQYSTLTLEGNPYSMGRQHGLQADRLRPRIAAAMHARFHQIELDGPDARFEGLLRETRELLEAIDRPLLDMIRGQADALGFEFETLLRYDMVTYLRDDLVIRRSLGNEGCTTWAASGPYTADGQPILVKNRDYRLEYLPLQLVVQATPSDGYPYLYVSSAGSPGVFSAGINDAGLAVADTHVYSSDLGPGLPDYALMMHLLEEHSSVSSALGYLRSVPRLGRNNLILADVQGHLAVFESGSRRFGLFETHQGALVNTNHFASAEMRDCFVDVDPPEARGRTFRRHERVTAALSAAHGQIDVPFAQHLMADHCGPLASLCCHPEANSQMTTISASIFLPIQRRLLFCHGLPCQGRYDEFSVGAVPAERPAPETRVEGSEHARY
jgi:isopenicillin-N N-acyltransferase-like protein